jgi:hypothetical protein
MVERWFPGAEKGKASLVIQPRLLRPLGTAGGPSRNLRNLCNLRIFHLGDLGLFAESAVKV